MENRFIRTARKTVAIGLTVSILCGSIQAIADEKVTLPLKYDFEQYNVGDTPTGFDYSGNGEIVKVNEDFGKKALLFESKNDGTFSFLKNKFEKQSNCEVKIKFDYLKRYSLTTDEQMFAVLNEMDEIFSLNVSDGEITYPGSDGVQTAVVDNYMPNKWYSFEITINLKSQTVTVYVNGKRRLTDVPILKNTEAIDGIKFLTGYTSGILLDNISVQRMAEMKKIDILGPEKISAQKDSTYKYEAIVYDVYDNILNNGLNVTWSSNAPLSSGISLIANPDNPLQCDIKLENVSYRGKITLTVSVIKDGVTLSQNYDVILASVEISKIEIVGNTRLAYGLDAEKYEYKIKFFDQYGAEIASGADIKWSVTGDTDGLEIDESTGRVSVTSELKESGKVKIDAFLVDVPAVNTSVEINTYTTNTYEIDSYIVDILKNCFDTSMEKYADTYHNTPLLASTFDFRNNSAYAWPYAKGKDIVMSNYAQDSITYYAFDILSQLTGDEKYADKVNEICDWYLKNGLSNNYLGYWGGHNAIDLRTSSSVDCSKGSGDYHEIKGVGLNFDPFFELDYDTACKMCKSIILTHLQNINTVDFNRHGLYSKKTNLDDWDIVKTIQTEKLGIVDSQNIPFRVFMSDLVYVLATYYRQTGDKLAISWAKLILRAFYNLQNKETGILPALYQTARFVGTDPAKYDPLWYVHVSSSGDHFTESSYGDRFWNQFAEDLVDQGFYPKSALDDYTMTELYYERNAMDWINPTLDDLAFYDAIKDDDPEFSEEILQKVSQNLTGILKYSWIEGTANCRKILTDGTDITHFKPKKNGYFGLYYGTDKEMGYGGTLGSTMPVVGARLLCLIGDKEGYDEQKEWIIKAIKYYINSMGLASFEKCEKNSFDEMELMTENLSYPPAAIICSFVDLYKYTGNVKFLELSRAAVLDLIKSNYKYGMFAESAGAVPGNKYISEFGGKNSGKYYAMIYYLAEIYNKSDIIKRAYVPLTGYWNTNYYDEPTEGVWIGYDYTEYARQNDAVLINKIQLSADKQDLKIGDSIKLNYSYKPNDATNTSVVWVSSDPKVVRYDEKAKTVTAVGKGNAEICCYYTANDIVEKIQFNVSE